jgi:uncharacterized membrane protein HdeD (DUF308 family)
MDGQYCQFGKRFLDGFSWIAPVTNNRLGDALNIEFVHEQLFTIEGERVLQNIGYGDKGKRFSEEEFGKPIKTLQDIEKNGYWLVGRTYHPDAVKEALAEVDDGHYYSFFSNQCQDWADRLARRIERIEKARGLTPLGKPEEETRASGFWKEKPPTAPASVLLGLLAIGLGVGSILAPAVAAHRSVWILALFLGISGVSEIAYALHGRVWSQILGTIFFAFLNIAAGLALFLDTQIAASWAGGLFGIAFGINGLSRIVVAVRSRPFLQWLGTLLTGLAMLVGSVLLLTRTIGERDVLFGIMIGFNLLLGGFATLWLRWTGSRGGGH